jgi:hypothetical protein
VFAEGLKFVRVDGRLVFVEKNKKGDDALWVLPILQELPENVAT